MVMMIMTMIASPQCAQRGCAAKLHTYRSDNDSDNVDDIDDYDASRCTATCASYVVSNYFSGLLSYFLK